MNKRFILTPKYWPIWLGLAVVQLLVRLPYRWQMRIGRFLGWVIGGVARSRRRVVMANLTACFPDLSTAEREHLMRKSFASFGMGVMETLLAWWMPQRLFEKVRFDYPSWERFLAAKEAAKASGRGLLLCSGHFTCLEMVGRHFGQREPFSLVYRPPRDPFMAWLMRSRRQRYLKKGFERLDLRGMVKALRKGEVLWYAPDQDFGAHRSVFVPFFGVQTATLKATSWLVEKGNAVFLPVFFRRLEDDAGYEITVIDAFEDFACGDEVEDARRFNAALEAFVAAYPDQYHWLHKRFKSRPEGEAAFY